MPRFSSRVFKRRVPWQKKKGVVKSVEEKCDSTPPSSNLNSTETPNSSQRKLLNVNSNYDEIVKGNEQYEVIDVSILAAILNEHVLCKQCASSGLDFNVHKHVGLVAVIELVCKNCKYAVNFNSSKSVKIDNTDIFNINVRLVYGLRSIGKGKAGGDMLCGLMNLPAPPSKFEKYNSILGSAAEDIAMISMNEAQEEAVILNNNDRDISAAFDGTWQKRGHMSKNGVVTVTSIDTGKVIECAVMSKHCVCPEKDKQIHEENCKVNFQGSSGNMEATGVSKIFNRSVNWHNLRYLNYLGDGDSRAFNEIVNLKPYGNDVTIQKLECIGHIQKRMGSRLRKLKCTLKGTLLSDGKSISGKNRLTDASIDRLQNYYGLAIRQNIDSVEKMRKAIWAIFFHTGSTHDNPSHGLCPAGADSWCKFNKGKVTGETYHHNNSLPVAVMDKIKHIFRDLSDPNLLKKCLHGRTQNPNESVHNVIWNRLPKTTFIGINTLHFGVYDAIGTFNKGNIIKCQVLQALGIDAGCNTVEAMKRIDRSRLRNAENKLLRLTKEAKQYKRGIKRKLLLENEVDADEPSYGAGLF